MAMAAANEAGLQQRQRGRGEDRGTGTLRQRCGFSSAEVLRRALHRRLGVGPAAYRERFRLAA